MSWCSIGCGQKSADCTLQEEEDSFGGGLLSLKSSALLECKKFLCIIYSPVILYINIYLALLWWFIVF